MTFIGPTSWHTIGSKPLRRRSDMAEVTGTGPGPTEGPVVPLLPRDTDLSRDRSSFVISAQHPAAVALRNRTVEEQEHMQEWSTKVKHLQVAMTALREVPGTEAMQEELRQRLAQDKTALKFCQGRAEAYQHAYQIITQEDRS